MKYLCKFIWFLFFSVVIVAVVVAVVVVAVVGVFVCGSKMHLETLRGTLCNCRLGRCDLIKAEATQLSQPTSCCPAIVFVVVVVVVFAC